jgi:hypothetical protein
VSYVEVEKIVKKLRIILIIVAALVILGLVVAPYVRIARSRAQRTSCMSHISMFAMGLVRYGMDHNGKRPLDLQCLTNYVYQPILWICPESGHKPGAMTNVAEWTDYGYVSGLTGTDPAGAVIMFCLPENHKGVGANVLFNDGSVCWVGAEEFTALTNTPHMFYGTCSDGLWVGWREGQEKWWKKPVHGDEAKLKEIQSRTKIIWPKWISKQ